MRLVSLRPISTGRTADLKARDHGPSTRPASLDSRLRSTLMGNYPDMVAMIAGAQYPAQRHGSTTRTARRWGTTTAVAPATIAPATSPRGSGAPTQCANAAVDT